MPLPWGDAHLPNSWHLSADCVPIPPVLVSVRARREEIDRRHVRLPPDLVNGRMYALDSPLWDTWFRDEHDLQWQSYFAGSPQSPPRRTLSTARAPIPPQPRGRRLVRGLTPTPSPTSSPPLPAPMTTDEEEAPMRLVMEDSLHTHDELQWQGHEEMMAPSAAGDVAFPKLDAYVKEEAMEEAPTSDGTRPWSGSPVRSSHLHTSTSPVTRTATRSRRRPRPFYFFNVLNDLVYINVRTWVMWTF